MELTKTLEGTLDAEDRPVRGYWKMRFTLFPPQDNVMVANGERDIPCPVIGPLPKPCTRFRF